jgi:hypothetical protein
LPGLISAPVASVRSARGGSGGSSVAGVEVEWGATAEGVGSGTTACGSGLAEEIRIGYRFLTVQLTARHIEVGGVTVG